MAQTAYWVIAPTCWLEHASGVCDPAANGVGRGCLWRPDRLPTSGSGTITEATLVTALSAGTGYTVAWTVYDDVALTYSNIAEAPFTTLNPVSVSVPAAALTLTAYAAAVTASAHQTVSVPAGALTLTGYAPTATASEHQTVSVPAASLTLTGYAPAVNIGGNQTVSPPFAALTISGFAPDVTASNHQSVAVPASALTLTGYAPSVDGQREPDGSSPCVCTDAHWLRADSHDDRAPVHQRAGCCAVSGAA